MAPKKKQEKMSLGTFLQDETLGSWADEMEDMPLPEPQSRTSYGERRAFSTNTGAGGTSFGGDRRLEGYSVREQLPLPDKPPYTVHLANLSFDANQDDVNEFFQGCEVSSVRIVEDKMDRKPKGFGYVEFATLDGLKAALALTGNNLAGRQVRISVADPPKNDRPEAREISDWSRKGPLPDLPNQRRVSERPGYNRSFDNMSDAGSERGTGRRAFGGESDGKIRDFSNWERRGPLSPPAGATGPALSLREGGRQASRNSPSWGEGRSNDGSRPPRKEFEARPLPERQQTAADMDNQWRAKMRPDAPAKTESPEASAPNSPAPSAPASRPRLNLQKRTVSEADPVAAAATASDSKASPFGAAKPVDTAAKEREVAEKREREQQEKRETEEKAKAERAEEKKLAREKADSERKEVVSKDEDASEEKPAKPKFDILRRTGSETNDMIADDETEETEENGRADDKAEKPKASAREAPGNKANGGTWRRGPKEPTKPVEKTTEPTTTETVEEDGWSTVSKPQKQRNNRRTNPPARAIAS